MDAEVTGLVRDGQYIEAGRRCRAALGSGTPGKLFAYVLELEECAYRLRPARGDLPDDVVAGVTNLISETLAQPGHGHADRAKLMAARAAGRVAGARECYCPRARGA